VALSAHEIRRLLPHVSLVELVRNGVFPPNHALGTFMTHCRLRLSDLLALNFSAAQKVNAMRNDDENPIDLKMLPEGEMQHFIVERGARRALWLVIALGVLLILPYLI